MSDSCERCGTTAAQLGAPGGRMGCSDCYSAFREELTLTFARRAVAGNHLGLQPEPRTDAEARHHDLARLQALLNRSVAAEDFEAAARLRDQITNLESWISEEDGG